MITHVVHAAVRDAMLPYIEKLTRLIERSENRVDNVNAMMMRMCECERAHAQSLENASGMFKLAVERYTDEIGKMREFRDEQMQTIKRMQTEIDRLNEMNAEMMRTHQMVVAQMSHMQTINVSK